MPDLSKIVKDKLIEIKRSDLSELWETIYNSYEDGGPSAVEETILKQLSQLRRGASREIKGIKEVIPKKRKKRRR